MRSSSCVALFVPLPCRLVDFLEKLLPVDLRLGPGDVVKSNGHFRALVGDNGDYFPFDGPYSSFKMAATVGKGCEEFHAHLPADILRKVLDSVPGAIDAGRRDFKPVTAGQQVRDFEYFLHCPAGLLQFVDGNASGAVEVEAKRLLAAATGIGGFHEPETELLQGGRHDAGRLLFDFIPPARHPSPPK
jgi:hypothetical protein